MKKNIWLLIIMISIGCGAFGCAAMTGVPRGSELIVVYQGTFNGTYNEGSIEVKLYQAPDGGKPFYGHFGEEDSFVNFTGEMTDDELQGQILLPGEGTISGELSADGEWLNGTYIFTAAPFEQGTWKARKQ